jgi:hypothetical protein
LALDASEDMVLLTPDEINRFISTLKTRYGPPPPVHAKKRTVRALRA